jgi:hypothetical protein
MGAVAVRSSKANALRANRSSGTHLSQRSFDIDADCSLP